MLGLGLGINKQNAGAVAMAPTQDLLYKQAPLTSKNSTTFFGDSSANFVSEIGHEFQNTHLVGDGATAISFYAALDGKWIRYYNVNTLAWVEVVYNHATGLILSLGLEVLEMYTELGDVYALEEVVGDVFYNLKGSDNGSTTATSTTLDTFRAGRNDIVSNFVHENRGKVTHQFGYSIGSSNEIVPPVMDNIRGLDISNPTGYDAIGGLLQYVGKIKLPLYLKDSGALKGNGTDNYIDLGLAPIDSADWYWEVLGKFNSLDSTFELNGSREATNNDNFHWGINPNDTWQLGYKNDTERSVISADTDLHIFKCCGNGKFYIDDVLTIDKSLVIGNIATIVLWLGGRNLDGSLIYPSNFTALYSKIVYQGETLQYIPFSGYAPSTDLAAYSYIDKAGTNAEYTLEGTVGASNIVAQDSYHENMTNGFDLWQNDTDSTYYRVPFDEDGNSILTSGGTLAGYTWVSRHPQPSNHLLPCETKFEMAREPMIVQHTNFFRDDAMRTMDYDDIFDFKNKIFVRDKDIYKDRLLVYKSELSGSALTRAINYTSPYEEYFRIEMLAGLMDFSIANADNVKWYFPDGTTSTADKPAKTLASDGIVYLTCSDFSKSNIEIKDNGTDAKYVGDTSDFPNFIYYASFYSTSVTGDVADIKATNTAIFYNTAVTGDVADIKATYYANFGGTSVTGDVADIKATYYASFASTEVTGDVADIKATNTASFYNTAVTGDVADIKATYYANFGGTSVTGDVADIKATNTARFYNTAVTGDVADIKATNIARFYNTAVTGDVADIKATNIAYFYNTAVTGDLGGLHPITNYLNLSSTTVYGAYTQVTGTSVPSTTDLSDTSMTATDMDNTLIAYAATTKNGGSFTATNMTRTSASDAAVATLEGSPRNWTISDITKVV